MGKSRSLSVEGAGEYGQGREIKETSSFCLVRLGRMDARVFERFKELMEDGTIRYLRFQLIRRD